MSGGRCDCGAATGEEVDAQLIDAGAVDLDDAQLEFDLLAMRRDDAKRVDDVLRVKRSHLQSRIGGGIGGDRSSKEYLAFACVSMDGGSGKGLFERGAQGVGIEVRENGVEMAGTTPASSQRTMPLTPAASWR